MPEFVFQAPFVLPAGGIAALLFVLFAWMTFRQGSKSWIKLRIFLIGLALFSMWGMYSRPAVKILSSAQTAVLLTEGATQNQLDDLLAGADSLSMIFALPDAIKSKSAGAVTDLYDLKHQYPAVNKLIVLGHGLPPADEQIATTFDIDFRPSPPPAGITSIDFPFQIQLGDTAYISGEFNAYQEDVLLKISSEFSPLDSIWISKDTTVDIKYLPRQAGGNELYFSQFNREGKQIVSDSLGIFVAEPIPLKILILNSQPSFETNYLKNWLAENQHKVVTRTAISQDRFRTEWLNINRMNVDRLSNNVLSRFDLVLTDDLVLKNLTRSEKRGLQNQISENGLGLLTFAGGSIEQNSDNLDFFLPFDLELADSENLFRATRLQRKNGNSTSVPASILSAEITPRLYQTVIVEDLQGRPAVISSTQGKGKVATSIVDETWRWIIQQDTVFYGQFWADILGAIAKPDQSFRLTNIDPIIPSAGKTTRLTFSGSPPENLTISRDTLSLQQSIWESDKWTAAMNVTRPGWNKINGLKRGLSVYFSGNAAWKTVRLVTNRQNTAKVAAREARLRTLSNKFYTLSKNSIFTSLFFLIFVTSVGFLWYLERSTT